MFLILEATAQNRVIYRIIMGKTVMVCIINTVQCNDSAVFSRYNQFLIFDYSIALLERKLSVAGIPRYDTKQFVICTARISSGFSDFCVVSRTTNENIHYHNSKLVVLEESAPLTPYPLGLYVYLGAILTPTQLYWKQGWEFAHRSFAHSPQMK